MKRSHTCTMLEIMGAIDFEELENDKLNKKTIKEMLEESGHCNDCEIKGKCPWFF